MSEYTIGEIIAKSFGLNVKQLNGVYDHGDHLIIKIALTQEELEQMEKTLKKGKKNES